MNKSIIFDLDGTLWDSTNETFKVWQNVGKKYNLEVTKEQIENCMGLTKEEIIISLFGEDVKNGEKYMDEALISQVEYVEKNGAQIYKNTIRVLEELKNKYELYIVSNCQSGYIEAFLSYYKLEKYFKDFECPGNTNKDKSYNIGLVIERNDIKNAVYVGDTNHDYIASKNNNLKFIWAKYGFGKCENYDKCINDISDIVTREEELLEIANIKK